MTIHNCLFVLASERKQHQGPFLSIIAKITSHSLFPNLLSVKEKSLHFTSIHFYKIRKLFNAFYFHEVK